jgi:hypothetical protein
MKLLSEQVASTRRVEEARAKEKQIGETQSRTRQTWITFGSATSKSDRREEEEKRGARPEKGEPARPRKQQRDKQPAKVNQRLLAAIYSRFSSNAHNAEKLGARADSGLRFSFACKKGEFGTLWQIERNEKSEQTRLISGQEPLHLSIYSRFPYNKPSGDLQSNARFNQGLIFIRRCWR